jgi:hypothetical protein
VPGLQVNPHDVPSQVSVALTGGAGHGVHDVVPQLSRLVLLSQPVPHAWKFGSQVMPHDVLLSQAAAPLAGTGHGVHEVPQLSALELLSHAPVHAW